MVKRQNGVRYRGLIVGGLALIAATGPVLGATSVKIGRTNIPDVSHLPIYVAMETGLFRQEGLDARFVIMPERALVTAGLGGAVDFVPLPRAGAKAALRGAALRFVVGQSLFTPSALVAQPTITAVRALRYQKMGFGQIGQARYRDGETVLRDRFGLVLDRDYRAVTIPGEEDRLAALENGDIQAGLFSLVHAAKAEARGFRRLFRTGVFLPRIGGAVWTRAAYLRANRDTVRRFIRAVARASDLIHIDGKATLPVIQKYLGLNRWEEIKALWLNVRDIYTADIPAPLLAALFAERRQRLLQKGVRQSSKKPPNPEYFIARDLLTGVLNRMAYAAESFSITAGNR